MQRRSFLLLQGVCSPFFLRLAERLAERGHRVVKVNFTAGDSLYTWRGADAHAFRGPLEELDDFVDALWTRYAITDQVLFGDCRAVHRSLVEGARRHGIRNHVFEEGYFRPFRVTLEREGVNNHSLLPRDPHWYREMAHGLPEPAKPRHFDNPFHMRALHDVCYHLAGLSHPLSYPHYRTHAPVTAPLEYTGYAWRFARLPYWKRRDAKRIERLLASGKTFYLLPLQLNGDAQIQRHSSIKSMRGLIERAMHSFARHAPSDSLLVIKNHPLDMGLVDYARHIRRLTKELALESRVVYLESGNLEAILKQAAGTVTVNSTVGNVALGVGCPTLALADPIYRMPGLTHCGDLDGFWRAPIPPDPRLFEQFRRIVIHTTQINGGFYCRDGIAMTVENATGILEAEQSPLERLLCQPLLQRLAS
nr:capsular biosynthesis protein [uncultured Halomonas sp.]